MGRRREGYSTLAIVTKISHGYQYFLVDLASLFCPSRTLCLFVSLVFSDLDLAELFAVAVGVLLQLNLVTMLYFFSHSMIV